MSEKDVDQEDINRLIDLYFAQPKILVEHLFGSFHQMVEEIIPYGLSKNNYFYENVENNYIYLHGFKCENIRLRPCTFDNDNKFLFPNEARKNYLNYFSSIIADVSQYVEKEDILTGEKIVKVIDKEKSVPLGKIPIMIKSKYCSTVIKKDLHGECKYDPGGYFLVNGQEKVVISIESMVDNKPMIFSKKDSGFSRGYYSFAHINSRENDWSDNLQIITIKEKKNGSFVISTSQFIDIPIFVMFRLLGLESDKEIISCISYDMNDVKLLNLLRPSIFYNFDAENNPIKTKEEAIEFMITKLKRNRRISQSDEELAKKQKRVYLEKLLLRNFFPHLGEDMPKKIRFLGYMINKLLNVILGRRKHDDRDSLQNKRIETPGVLISQLFRQNWKKLLNEIGKNFRKKNQSDDNPLNVIGQIRSNTIEQGIKTALATGMWGMNKTKKGVAQSLARLSWIQAQAYLRRIMSPGMKDSTSASIISIRMLNNISVGFLCPTETPEGAKIGIVKSLAMTATISLQNRSQDIIIKNIINNFSGVKHPADIDPLEFNEYSKIFINGNWVGVVKSFKNLYDELISKRRNNIIEKTVTISSDYTFNELRVYTDGGRLIRPLLVVKDKKLVFNKKILKEVNEYLDNLESDKGWKKLLSNHPDLIDYEDIESSNYIMVSRRKDELNNNLEKFNKTVKYEKDTKLNRYGDFRYINYTHCELHPWLMLGSVTSTIPFANHNYGTKNIVNYSQVKHAIGTYLTSYKDRMDISYTLYNPQIPVVRTKGTKYNKLDNLPAGENTIVAIMSYTGYNQEDSLIFNQSAIDRGLFRVDSLKKYHSQVEKNPSTSQDDIFLKPDRNKVTGMKQGNYDKLNEKGYIPEETEIENGDILIGKVSPIQPTGNNNKVYKDNSEVFKSNVKGVVDRIHTGVYNSDGYEMYNMRVRMERTPVIGDKFCLPGSTQVLTDKGWIQIKDINIKDYKVATFDSNKKLTYINPSDKYEFDHEGDMYYYENKHVKIECTLNHKLYVKSRSGKEFKLIEATNVKGKMFRMKNNIINDYDDIEKIEIGNKSYLMDYWLKLLGMYISDGNIIEDNMFISCVKDRKVNFCRKFFNDLGIDYNYSYDKFKIRSKEICDHLLLLGKGSKFKVLPDYVWNLSQRQSRILLDSLIEGDGHKYDDGFCRYGTINLNLANDISKLAFHCGWSGTIKLDSEPGRISHGKRNLGYRKGQEITIEQKNKYYKISIIKKHNEPWINKKKNNSNIEEIRKYNGKVYCIEVPESHVFYMRYSELSPPIWTGNSNRHG